mmetsp:Transcript_46574/g.149594  ORF Transcript_46574/g.149594 Transcript_46574/m.149594 type:complete len:282 (-) Transcript_46574:386-1231(-)
MLGDILPHLGSFHRCFDDAVALLQHGHGLRQPSHRVLPSRRGGSRHLHARGVPALRREAPLRVLRHVLAHGQEHDAWPRREKRNRVGQVPRHQVVHRGLWPDLHHRRLPAQHLEGQARAALQPAWLDARAPADLQPQQRQLHDVHPPAPGLHGRRRRARHQQRRGGAAGSEPLDARGVPADGQKHGAVALLHKVRAPDPSAWQPGLPVGVLQRLSEVHEGSERNLRPQPHDLHDGAQSRRWLGNRRRRCTAHPGDHLLGAGPELDIRDPEANSARRLPRPG